MILSNSVISIDSAFQPSSVELMYLFIEEKLNIGFWKKYYKVSSFLIVINEFKRNWTKTVHILLKHIYCQAQFKFSTSSVQFELRLSLKPGYYHPHPPGKEEIQQLLDYIGH